MDEPVVERPALPIGHDFPSWSPVFVSSLLQVFQQYGYRLNRTPTANDLGGSFADGKGAALVGDAVASVNTIDDLRNVDSSKLESNRAVNVLGYHALGDGGGGLFRADLSDTSSSDDGGLVIVAADSTRWKRVHEGTLSPEQFGARFGHLFDATVRAVLNDSLAEAPLSAAYARLLERAIRRFVRAGVWGDVSTAVDSSGYVTFSASGLTTREQKAFDWILARHDLAAEGANDAGPFVTAADLNAAEAIDVTANTFAMQSWLSAISDLAAVGVLSGFVYPVNDTLRPINSVTIQGQRGLSRIKMADDVPYNKPVILTGIEDVPASDITLRDFIADANYFNRAATAGTSVGNTDLWGSAICIAYTENALIERVEAWDARKHCIDITGSDYRRSGTAYTYLDRNQISQRIKVVDCSAEGFGDDGITTHNCIGVEIIRPWVAFSTGVFASNTNGVEIDDASSYVYADAVEAYFCRFGVEVKGHEDSLAPSDVEVTSVRAEYCDAAFVCRHLGHGTGAEPASPSAKRLRVGAVTLTSPLGWSALTTARSAAILFAYAGVEVDSIAAYQGDAPSDFFGTDSAAAQGAVVVAAKASNVSIGRISTEGFDDSVAVLRVSTSADGPVAVGSISSNDCPLRAVSHTGSAPLRVGILSADRAGASAGSIAVRPGDTSGSTRISELRATGFETVWSGNPNSLRRPVGSITTSGDDLNDIGDGEQIGFDATFAWTSASAPSNAPAAGFYNMIHLQRSTASRVQIACQSNGSQRMFVRGFTGGSWEPWREVLHAGSVATSISGTPNFIGQVAVVAGEGYMATGTGSSADWKQIT